MARRSSKARRHPKSKPQGVIDLNARGFGFVKTAEGEFFIPASKTMGAFPGDLVEVSRVSSHKESHKHSASDYVNKNKLPTGRVTKILMRAQDTVFGHYEIAEPFGVVVPEDPRIPCDIFTLHRDNPQVHDGDVVEVRITEFPSRNTAATGVIERVLGHAGDATLEVDLIIAQYQLETEFSQSALDEAEELSMDVDWALAHGYRDIRDRLIFTIDPFDARDFDDALSLSLEDGLYHVGVHIADVSHYVRYNSALDMDASKRATSVYLVDRVLPMLPEKISNNLCSLVPGQPRLTMSVDVTLKPDGTVVGFEVYPAIIQSKARLSYDQAEVLLDEHKDFALAQFKQSETPQGALPLDDQTILDVRDRIISLRKLAKTLFSVRYQKGCMDFDRVEARVRLDADNKPLEIMYRRRTDATQVVEECMILANTTVATWLVSEAMPCVFRVHDAPDSLSLASLYKILQEFPLFKGIDKQSFCDGDPQTLQHALRLVENTAAQELFNSLLLRSMKRAIYTTEKSAHYGLALDCYCHFTSPIRRYPDLLVHRMCKEKIFGHTATYEAQKNSLQFLAEHSSKMERIADKASQESQLVKIIEYLQAFIGQEFDTIISNVSTFGVTLRMDNTAQGLLPLDDLGDEYFSYDPERFTLTGTDTGIVYRLGQSIKAVLVEANPRRRILRFKRSDAYGSTPSN